MMESMDNQTDCMTVDRMPGHSDEMLLLEYRETFDRELFAELVRRYEQELFNYLCRYLGDAGMAEDAFQTTFLQVHLKCGQFEAGKRLRPWLYAIATNQGIDAQRRNRRHQMASLDRVSSGADGNEMGKLVDLLVSGHGDPLDHASQTEWREWVGGAMNELSDQMRSVVHLVYYQGMKYREAADALSVPVGTIKSRLHAAIAKLNEYWAVTHVQRK
jgi:RNA polymerase sigma-70 factor, ECF subfamily